MANLVEMTAEKEAEADKGWQSWLEGRPQVIQDLGQRFKPWKLYRHKGTDQRVVPTSFNESGTITVAVMKEYNLISMERQVFGINPDDLEECDLPGPEEIVGVYLTEDEQLLMVNRRRAEFNNPPLTLQQFRQYGQEGEHLGDGDNLEPVDRDVPPPEIKP